MLERLRPFDTAALDERQLWILVGSALLIGVVALSVQRIWLILRIAVTVVHELGHAVIGMICGRRLLGIRVSRDMSGETVTAGKPHGPGLAFTTFAGYPVPPVVGSVLILAGAGGWSQIALFTGAALLALLLVTVRSALTAVSFLGAIAVLGSLWWLDDPMASAGGAIAIGVVLTLGGLRAIGSLIAEHSRGRTARSDAAVLAHQTRVPAGLWLTVFTLISLIAAALAAAGLADVLGLLDRLG